MINFIVGTIFGVVISTVGFGTFVHYVDSGVEKIKNVAIEQVK